MEKKRILIADDEEAIRILLAVALKIYDYELDIVENGLEAINNIYKRSYDLIITDYMMPEMDGLELTKRIRSDIVKIMLK
jgi:CheY-like chemotaxis protein